MAEVIRTVRLQEREAFERFLERCYGCGWGAFERWGPELLRDDEAAMQHHLVLEADGRLASHVGGYPLELVMGPARVVTAGVGGVGTHPEARGRGYMSRLLEESLRRWREWGWTLSALWGDRQRYGSFGWEIAGLKYAATVSRRSLERHGIQAAEIEEANPRDPCVIEQLRAWHRTLGYRVERPHFDLQLRREGVRVFLGEDGYLLSRGDYGDLRVSEIVSPTGREPELIAAAMGRTFAGMAHVEFGPGECGRLARVIGSMSGWHLGNQGMFRILDWPGLLRDLGPLLAEKAAGLPSFLTSVGCRWRDETEWATAEWDGEAFHAKSGRVGEGIEIDLPTLTGLLLGGPYPDPPGLGLFGRLLPVPVHVPAMDHV